MADFLSAILTKNNTIKKMNKLSFLILIFFLIANYTYSQNQGKIFYKKINVDGKMNTSILIYDEHESFFYTILDKAITKPFRDEYGTLVQPSNTIDSIANKRLFNYYDMKKNKFYLNNINKNQEILMSITPNNDEWMLTDETKQIGDFKCFMAYKIINEKKYFAWFTEQLPLPYGPIAINGLKGVILELYNEDKTVFFEFEKFENTSELVQSYISEYDFSNAITYQEYLELKK